MLNFENSGVNPQSFRSIFDLLDENKTAVKIGIPKIDNALEKGGFISGSLNALETNEILFDAVFCDFVRQAALSGNKICICHTANQKNALKETFKNAALDFGGLKNGDSIVSFELEKGENFENFCQKTQKSNVDFVFLYHGYTQFKVNEWKEIKHFADIYGICIFCANPLHFPSWVQSGSKLNDNRIDRADNKKYSYLGDVPSPMTFSEYFDVKILARPQGYANARGRCGTQESVLKDFEREYKKYWISKIDFEIAISAANPVRESTATIFPAVFSRRKGFEI